MQLTVNNKRVKIGGRIARLSKNESLLFQVKGSHFPYSNYEPPVGGINYNGTYVKSSSFGYNEMKIDFGDGFNQTYIFVNNGLTLVANPANQDLSVGTYPPYYFQDSNTDLRIIRIQFLHPSRVSSFEFRYNNLYGVLPSSIFSLSMLTAFRVSQSELTIIPSEFSLLNNLRTLILSSVGTAISLRIPDAILNLQLTSLNLAGSVDLSDIYASNFYNFCEGDITDILEYLSISNTQIVELPSNFTNLTKLKSFVGINSSMDVFPPELLNMPNLEQITVGGGNIINIDGIEQLINLDLLRYNRSRLIKTTVPLGMENCTLLKQLQTDDSYHTQIRIDEFVNNLYNFIISEASISAGNTKFRQMNIRTDLNGNIDPSGTYQQPAGFVLGSSNGNPSSPMEEIWVMVNQYQHTWTY